MASVCSYTSYTPSSCHQLLTRIKEFLESKGWHTTEFEQAKAWLSDGDGTYSFQAGGDSESFLEIISEGYDYEYGISSGNQQTMKYRFRVEASGDNPLAEYLRISLVDPNDLEIDDTNGSHPISQNYVYTLLDMGIPTGTGATLHCFDLTTGSPTFDIFVIQFSDYFVNMFAIGCPDLFKDTDEMWCLHGCDQALAYYDITALNMNTKIPKIKWNGPRQSYDGVWTPNFWCGGLSGYRNAYDGFIAPFGRTVLKNDYTGKRSFVKPIWFATDNNDQLWPVGTMPWYFCKWGGLDMAETIIYGSQQYVVFPDGFTNKEFGIGIRIT